MLRKYSWGGFGCINAYFHLGLMDTCMHIQTDCAGDGRPQHVRGQSSNSVIMKGQKELLLLNLQERNQMSVSLVKSAAINDLCCPSASQEHHPRPFCLHSVQQTPSKFNWFQSFWGAGELPWCYCKMLTAFIGWYCCVNELGYRGLQIPTISHTRFSFILCASQRLFEVNMPKLFVYIRYKQVGRSCSLLYLYGLKQSRLIKEAHQDRFIKCSAMCAE